MNFNLANLTLNSEQPILRSSAPPTPKNGDNEAEMRPSNTSTSSDDAILINQAFGKMSMGDAGENAALFRMPLSETRLFDDFAGLNKNNQQSMLWNDMANPAASGMESMTNAFSQAQLQEKIQGQMMMQQRLMQEQQPPAGSPQVSRMNIANKPSMIDIARVPQFQGYVNPYKMPSPNSVASRALLQPPATVSGVVPPQAPSQIDYYNRNNAIRAPAVSANTYQRNPAIPPRPPAMSMDYHSPTAYQMQMQGLGRANPQMMNSLQAAQSMYGQSQLVNQAYAAAQAGASMNASNGRMYQVQFKCTVRYFTLGAQAPPTINVGDFVVVEADRGEDIGVVTELLSMKTFVERRVMMKMTVDDDESVIGRIIRLATMAERQMLPEKFRNEENVLQMCRELASNTYRLPMVIHNVDYQFDRHKLTIHYTADTRVDFREFVRDLFSAYKARIWMKKVDPYRAVCFDQTAAVALATGMQINGDASPSYAASNPANVNPGVAGDAIYHGQQAMY